MIAVLLATVLGLVLLAWTRDGLTIRQFGAWLCDRAQIEPGSTFTQDVARSEAERRAIANALKNRSAR